MFLDFSFFSISAGCIENRGVIDSNGCYFLMNVIVFSYFSPAVVLEVPAVRTGRGERGIPHL